MNGRSFYVLLNKEADRTISISLPNKVLFWWWKQTGFKCYQT